MIQQRRTPVVDAGDAYKPGYESVVAHAKASSSSRLTRIQQVREQEKLWARFQAREFRAAVKDHHVELTNQLHQGWLEARALKQQELERDYSGAVVGVGRAQRDAAALGDATAKKRRARERWRCKSSTRISARSRGTRRRSGRSSRGWTMCRRRTSSPPTAACAPPRSRTRRARTCARRTPRSPTRKRAAGKSSSSAWSRRRMRESRGRHAADARWPPPRSRTRTSTTWWWTARRASPWACDARGRVLARGTPIPAGSRSRQPPPPSRWTASPLSSAPRAQTEVPARRRTPRSPRSTPRSSGSASARSAGTRSSRRCARRRRRRRRARTPRRSARAPSPPSARWRP